MNIAPALDTLFLPFRSGALTLPTQGQVLFVGASAGAPIPGDLRDRVRWEQPFKPDADALRAAGFLPASEHDAPYAQAWLALPRQRDHARACLARAVQRTAVGGVVVACQANTEGARSGEADLHQLLGQGASLSKHKCRVFWGEATAAAKSSTRVAAWAELDAPRPVAGGRFLSRPGLFAWDRIDPASALLAEHLPSIFAGRVADLGAGYGFLAAEVLARNPQVTALDLFEADARALAMARQNLGGSATQALLGFHWHDVRAGLPGRYDAIVSNPPFHLGRADLPELGRAFIHAAADALRPGGALWLVANRHLPYESALAARFATVRAVVVRDGFKVIEAVKAGA